MRILLVEDDEILTSVLVDSLQQQRYVVDAIDDGKFGLEYAEGGTYDLLLVDVGLPRLDGISLCQQLRDKGHTMPILLMTAKDAPDEKIRGLDAGADDYLTKPLDLSELHARLRALLRRGEVLPTSVLKIGQLQLDPLSCVASYANNPIKLTPKEYSLLELFLRYPTRVFSRGHIIEHLWTFDDPPLEDSVKAHVKGLRRRLKQSGADGWIENVYGLGYKLSPKLEQKINDQAIAKLDEQEQGEQGQGEQGQGEQGQTAKVNDGQAAANKIACPQPIHKSVDDEAVVEQQFQQAMTGLWQQHRSAMTQRLFSLQQMVSALQHETLTDELCQSAAQAAHKLAGVLGMFGRDDGTQVARTLEEMLSNSLSVAAKPDIVTVTALTEKLTGILDLADESLGKVIALPSAKNRLSASSLLSFPLQSHPLQSHPLQSSHLSEFLPSAAAPIRILAVDDDPIFLSTLPPMLEPWGMDVTTLCDPTTFWETLTLSRPDLLILDIEMPNVGGIELCQAVRNDVRDQGQWQSLPILFLTARQNSAGEVFAVGADDYVVKPVLGPELITRISNRLERARLLKTLSRIDAQTGLVNQSQSQRVLQQWINCEQRFSLVLLRLVNLAQVNLDYGHRVGHQVLRAWGDEMTALLPVSLASHEANDRAVDVPNYCASYWGNGEFVVALPGVSKDDAKIAIAPLLRSFRQRVFTASITDRSMVKQTVSSSYRFQAQYALGLSVFPHDGSTLQRLYQVAYGATT